MLALVGLLAAFGVANGAQEFGGDRCTAILVTKGAAAEGVGR